MTSGYRSPHHTPNSGAATSTETPPREPIILHTQGYQPPTNTPFPPLPPEQPPRLTAPTPMPELPPRHTSVESYPPGDARLNSLGSSTDPRLEVPLPSTPPRTPQRAGATKRGLETPNKSEPHDSPHHHLNGWNDRHVPLWLRDVPVHLRRKIVWTQSYSTPLPKDAIILLFVGRKDGGALDEILAELHPATCKRTFAIDLKRCERTHNFLSEEPYNSLCTAAAEGRLSIVGGGPMCRTFSVLRLQQQDNYKGMICRGIAFRGNIFVDSWPFSPFL